jgi:hypothetical protein
MESKHQMHDAPGSITEREAVSLMKCQVYSEKQRGSLCSMQSSHLFIMHSIEVYTKGVSLAKAQIYRRV